MQKQPHPLDPMRPEEIWLASQILRKARPGEQVVFRIINLQEPSKSMLLPYLEAEHLRQTLPQRPCREAMVQFFSGTSEHFYEVVVDLERASIVSEKDLRGYHSYTDFEEQTCLEQSCLHDDRILKAIVKFDLPEGAVISVEPWTYAPDGVENATQRLTMNAVVAKSRVLILQTIITVAKYEYIIAFHFTQAASIRYEVRATGILSTAPIEINEQVPYGKVVAPGVMAPYHQHLFSLRIDPWLDGQKSSFSTSESVPMPLDQDTSPFGVGYRTRGSIIESESARDLDITKARTFRVLNEKSINPMSDRTVGYEIVPSPAQMLLAHPSSFHSRRSEFADHAFWVTRYHDGELFAAGDHTMQSQGGQGIASWIKGERSVGPSGTSISSSRASQCRRRGYSSVAHFRHHPQSTG
ncbi:hypothetical protein LTS17_008003 [Exophiala oligosperma]